MADLKQKAMKGFFWVALSSFIVQGGQFITKLILARLLMPKDFGILAMALVVTNALSLITDFGGGTAIVYFKKRLRDVVNTSFLMTTTIGLAFSILIYLSSDIVASFFNEPTVGSILKMFSIIFLLLAPTSVSKSMLIKELKFNKIILADMCSILIYAITTVSMALNGYGVWSLVAGYLGSVSTNAIVLMLISRWRPTLQFDIGIARKLVKYGKYVIMTSIIGFLALQGDSAVIGKMVNSTMLGFYVMAYTIANIPATQISGIISTVMFPSFSKLQNSFERLRNAYMKTLDMMLLVSIPFIFGVIAITGEFIKYVLGSKWGPIAVPLYMLLWFSLFRSLLKLTGLLFQAIGKPDITMKMMLYELIIFAVLVVPLTLRGGIIGTSIATTIPMFLAAIYSMYMVRKILGVDLLKLLKILFSATAYSLFMFISLLLIKNFLFDVNSLFRLLVLVFIGVSIYAATLLLLGKSRIYGIKEAVGIIFK